MLKSRFFRACTAALLAAFLLVGCRPEAATPLPPASGQTLRIVSSLPYKGPSALQSTLIRNGIDFAIDEKRSLLPNWKIEHVALDGGDTETGEWSRPVEEANARGAAQDSAVVLYIGPYNSGAAMVSIPILNSTGVLQALPVATWPGLTESGWGAGEPDRFYPTGQQTMLRLMPPDSAQARTAAQKAQLLGAKAALVVHDASDYSKGMSAAFRGEAERIELAVVRAIDANADAQEWSRALGQADVVFLAPSSLEVGSTMSRRLSEHPPRLSVFSTDVLLSDQLAREDRERMEGWFMTFNGDSTPGQDPIRFGQFASRFKQRFGTDPSQYAANTYDVTAAVLEAAANVGVDRQKLPDAMLGGTYEEGVTGPLRFHSNGDRQGGSLTLYRLVKGKFVQQEELAVP